MAGRTYAEPRTVDEAVALLTELGPDAGIVAGGTDLVVGARSGKAPLPRALVAIHRPAARARRGGGEPHAGGRGLHPRTGEDGARSRRDGDRRGRAVAAPGQRGRVRPATRPTGQGGS